MSARHGEKEATHFRSERTLCMNGQWFFAVREKTNLVGPYNTKQSAEKAAAAYANDILSGRSAIDAMSNQFLLRAFSIK